MEGNTAVFFTPPFPSHFAGMPCGLLELATACRNVGINSKVVDLSSAACGSTVRRDDWISRTDTVLRQVDGDSPFFGISATSPSVFDALELGRFLRASRPTSTIAIGGPHLVHDPQFLADPRASAFDWAFHGREAPLRQMAAAIASGSAPANIAQVSYRNTTDVRNSGRAGHHPTRKALPEMDHRLLQDASLYIFANRELAEYAQEGKTTQVYTSKGCPYTCRFCVAGRSRTKGYALKAVETRLRELDASGMRFVFFDDPTFTWDRERTTAVLKILSSLSFRWACQTRVDCVSEELLHDMRDAGCDYIFYGLESGSTRIKKFIRKDISNRRIRQAVLATHAVGIKVAVSVIFGVPRESPEDVQATLDLLSSMSVPIRVSPSFYAVYPGTDAEKDLAGEALDYLAQQSRESVWLEFDDGYGAHHVLPASHAQYVLGKLTDLAGSVDDLMLL